MQKWLAQGNTTAKDRYQRVGFFNNESGREKKSGRRAGSGLVFRVFPGTFVVYSQVFQVFGAHYVVYVLSGVISFLGEVSQMSFIVECTAYHVMVGIPEIMGNLEYLLYLKCRAYSNNWAIFGTAHCQITFKTKSSPVRNRKNVG